MLACVAKVSDRSRPGRVANAPLPVNRFPNKLAPKTPNKIMESPPLCSFASILIVWLTPFINKPDS